MVIVSLRPGNDVLNVPEQLARELRDDAAYE